MQARGASLYCLDQCDMHLGQNLARCPSVCAVVVVVVVVVGGGGGGGGGPPSQPRPCSHLHRLRGLHQTLWHWFGPWRLADSGPAVTRSDAKRRSSTLGNWTEIASLLWSWWTKSWTSSWKTRMTCWTEALGTAHLVTPGHSGPHRLVGAARSGPHLCAASPATQGRRVSVCTTPRNCIGV